MRNLLCLFCLLIQCVWHASAQGQFCAVLRLRNAPQFEDLEKLEALAVADFNSDSRPDLALALNDHLTRTYAVLIRLNNGNGGFNAPSQFTVQENPLALGAGDFDGDGRIDLVIAHRASGEFLRFYHGQGNGAFIVAAQLALTQPGDIAAITAADLNGDRRPELLVQSEGGEAFVNVLRNQGSGSFSAPVRLEGRAALVEDFNNDGKPDLALVRGDALHVLAGRGDGTFGAALNQFIALREAQLSLTAGDFNGDGKPDLAATTNPTTNNALAGQVVILLGNGAGDFTTRNTFTDVLGTIRFIRALRAGTRTDLVVTDGARLSYLQNNGAGQFSRTVTVLARGLRDAAVADFNNDGRSDFALLDKTVTLFNNSGGGFTDAPVIVEHQSQFIRVALGDLNNDGAEDLAALEAPDKLTILRGDGAGRFTRAQSFTLGDNPTDLLIADFNRDGRRDVAALYRGGLSIRLNNAGELGAATNIALASEPANFTALDYDADGRLDFAVTHGSSANLSLLRGNGSGGFESPRTVARAAGTTAIVSADFNGDGRGDLLIANNNERAYALTSNGDGTFTERGNYAIGATPHRLALGDFNADGRTDSAVGGAAAAAASDIVVLFSNSNGTFTPAPRIEWGNDHTPLTVTDLNSDGKSDLVLSNVRESLLLLPGDGAGKFDYIRDRDGLAFPRSYFALSAPLSDLVSRDLNRDGFPDFVLAGQGITVLYGTCLRTAAPLVALSAARYTAALAPEAIGAAFGSPLATATAAAATNPLPTNLAGTTGTLY